MKKQNNNQLLWGVVVETEAYSQEEPACHGHFSRSPKNNTLFGRPGQFYIYLTYGIYHCVNIVTDKSNWASGVLLRALAIPNENERIAAGPGLLAKRFELTKSHDNLESSIKSGLWLAPKPFSNNIGQIIRTQRIGISKGVNLPLRWYLQSSRSISRRAKGDHCPSIYSAWEPSSGINK